MRARTYIYLYINNYLMNITELNKLLKIYKNSINKRNFYIYHNFLQTSKFCENKKQIYKVWVCAPPPRGRHDGKYLRGMSILRYVIVI